MPRPALALLAHAAPAAALTRIPPAALSKASAVPRARPNIPAKILATAWYFLAALPDAQTRLHRARKTRDRPWYAPARVLAAAGAVANILSIPLSWALLAVGRRDASCLASAVVLANPPTALLLAVIAAELPPVLLRLPRRLAGFVTRPFRGKSGQGEPETASAVEPAN